MKYVSRRWVRVCELSCVGIFETPWTLARQPALSMGFFSGKNTDNPFYMRQLKLREGKYLAQGHTASQW